jgi:hypothetical protein
VRQRCQGIDIYEAARHHTLADACGPGYLAQHLVALAHRHALHGEVAQPRVPEGVSGKLYRVHLSNPDGHKVSALHHVPRAQPVVRPGGRTPH